MFFIGIDAWLNVSCEHWVYQNIHHQQIGHKTLIKIPFWKCSYICYLDILLLCELRVEDYPWEIGPYPCPMSWVSYMESTFQFRWICLMILSDCM